MEFTLALEFTFSSQHDVKAPNKHKKIMVNLRMEKKDLMVQ
jgi:hypothetical protein